MNRAVTASTATAAMTIALSVALTLHRGVTPIAAADPQSVLPQCPQIRYGANGNVQPLFCVVDNPAALKALAQAGKETFSLGTDATPNEVTDALVSDYKHGGTLPILCSIYKLAAWRNRWSFGISIPEQVANDLNVRPSWCAEPSFANID